MLTQGEYILAGQSCWCSSPGWDLFPEGGKGRYIYLIFKCYSLTETRQKTAWIKGHLSLLALARPHSFTGRKGCQNSGKLCNVKQHRPHEAEFSCDIFNFHIQHKIKAGNPYAHKFRESLKETSGKELGQWGREEKQWKGGGRWKEKKNISFHCCGFFLHRSSNSQSSASVMCCISLLPNQSCHCQLKAQHSYGGQGLQKFFRKGMMGLLQILYTLCFFSKH